MSETRGRNIGLHVRRGDYVSEIGNLGLLDSRYYSSALSKLGVASDDVVWVFSDSPDAAKDLLKDFVALSNFNFLNPPFESEPAESLYLMSQMSSMVIANSSFSWWAASLGKEKSVVIAPSPWFRSLEEPSGILCPSWTPNQSSWVMKDDEPIF